MTPQPTPSSYLSPDVLIIGSGIGGLSLALRVVEEGHTVTLITKKNRADSSTNYAQGGIACVLDEADQFSQHVADTLAAGDGLCDLKAVETIVKEGPECIKELIELGVAFSKAQDGSWNLAKEGGHSQRRILHVKDMTGKAIEEALLKAIAQNPRVTLKEHVVAIDLITESKLCRTSEKLPLHKDRILGLYALDSQSGTVLTFKSPVIVLATGGSGQVYLYTTNPDIATGDGVAMAHRAGVVAEGMEFVQFHPTALYSPAGERFLISEAVRGEGAILRNAQGTPFMASYHPQADLAPRDVVARAIDSEMKHSGSPHVWLDFTQKTPAYIQERFPTIWKVCQKHGIDPSKDFIPVVPAAHYQCGGVRTDLQGATALPGLYACGEVASTGLHGANRLASNSLLEAVVMAKRSAAAIAQYLKNTTPSRAPIPEWVDGNAQNPDERVVLSHVWQELKQLMWDYVCIVRTPQRLERALARLNLIEHEINAYYWDFKIEPKLIELRNMVLVARLIVLAAQARRESRGLHYMV